MRERTFEAQMPSTQITQVCTIPVNDHGNGSTGRDTVVGERYRGPPLLSRTTTASIREDNGSYAYSVATSDKTYTAPSGTLVVHGLGHSLDIEFSRVTYTATFTRSGLPSGTSWSVTVNGTSKTGTSSIAFAGLPNGTDPFSVGVVSGFNATPSSGVLTVRGGNTSWTIAFSAVPVSPGNGTGAAATFLGLPVLEGYAVLGGIILIGVVATVGAVLWTRKQRPPSSNEPPT